MPDRIDFVIIATLRPEILRLTLDSFRPLFEKFPQRRLILNVDPIGEQDCSQQDIVNLCAPYFSETISRTPDVGNFSAAVLWAWQQVQTPIFFHLEDDWCLRRNIDIESVKRQLETEDIVAIRLNLSKNKTAAAGENLPSDGLSLNPSFFRTSFVKLLVDCFDTARDPEKQFRPLPDHISGKKFVYYGHPKESSLVIDTGKRWRRVQGLNKWEKSAESIVWSTTNQVSTFLDQLKYRLFMWYWRLRYVRG